MSKYTNADRPILAFGDRLEALRDIESRDPDGMPNPPTARAYADHRSWGVATYGTDAWDHYRAGGWNPEYRDE